VDYTSTELVAASLGAATGPAFETDPYGALCVGAANAWVTRKRLEAGYSDDDDPPGDDVTLGATYYAQTLWRERASVDSFASFEDSGAFIATGSKGRILELIGCGRPQVDAADPATVAAVALRHRRRLARW
jgi:hypothetical protein